MCSENKGVISFAVTAKLICVFVFLHMQIAGFLMKRLIYLLEDDFLYSYENNKFIEF